MSDRTVIVTGGTRGIGLALAEGFVLAGARVAVASRKADACEKAASDLRDLGGPASMSWSTTPRTHSLSPWAR
jgi:NAD(P)-dependent dehydrogenase (short-subunit alcohol dehydrogenase family)